MNLLGFDTSSENLSVCIVKNGAVVFTYDRRGKFAASKLIPTIQKAFDKVRMQAGDFDAFFAGIGPGSFTGLRMGVAALKAFALATGKPVITVGSFFACAYAVRKEAAKIAVVADARRGLLYLARFRSTGESVAVEAKACLTDAGALQGLAGHQLITYDEHLASLLPAVPLHAKRVFPRARWLVPFAVELYRKKKFTRLESLQPLYLHPKTCQVQAKK